METAAQRQIRARNADDIWKRVTAGMLEEQARADSSSEQTSQPQPIAETALQAADVELDLTAPASSNH